MLKYCIAIKDNLGNLFIITVKQFSQEKKSGYKTVAINALICVLKITGIFLYIDKL